MIRIWTGRLILAVLMLVWLIVFTVSAGAELIGLALFAVFAVVAALAVCAAMIWLALWLIGTAGRP